MASSADTPSSASATTSIEPLDVSARTTPSRNSGWSSPTTTRTFSLVMEQSLAQQRHLNPPIGGHAIQLGQRPVARHTTRLDSRSLESSPDHIGEQHENSTNTGELTMNTNTRRFARYLALPVISAGIVGGAALGLAGTAGAATNADVRPPHVAASPDVRAHPAPN